MGIANNSLTEWFLPVNGKITYIVSVLFTDTYVICSILQDHSVFIYHTDLSTMYTWSKPRDQQVESVVMYFL